MRLVQENDSKRCLANYKSKSGKIFLLPCRLKLTINERPLWKVDVEGLNPKRVRSVIKKKKRKISWILVSFPTFIFVSSLSFFFFLWNWKTFIHFLILLFKKKKKKRAYIFKNIFNFYTIFLFRFIFVLCIYSFVFLFLLLSSVPLKDFLFQA